MMLLLVVLGALVVLALAGWAAGADSRDPLDPPRR
jgi:hypothetical protein